MGESIPFGDLIVIGAIALFIILRYRSILGQKSGHDFSKPSTSEKAKLQIVRPENQEISVEALDPKEEFSEMENAELADTLGQIRMADPQFTLSSFISGARTAFEMIIDAFNAHDRETLKMLLSKEVYESFEQNIKEQEEKNYRSETTLIALKSSEIIDAEFKRNVATVTVQFLSEQVHVVRDKEKNVVEGDASMVQDIADEWTFERDVKSRNPNWTIIAT